ncbi:hypothetical protein [Mesonia maritima]|uniref:Outer membrane protein beta-barrel domain-containing protein n=1 Tax=Mesonia maritima TaxID=1793873 RepID=A0ABU1K913_9FLAO|nr:hypothetical protein [Mesonia maritima]MDR6302088.1 hypothetical protein [Mesonia maritima]
MKKILIILTLFCSVTLLAQEQKTKAQVKIEELQAQKQTITQLEKEKLKEKVASINERLENEEISEEKAAELKKAAAEQHALNIENQYDLIDLNIELIKRNQTDSIAKNSYIDVGAILTDTKRMSAVDSIPSVLLAAPYVGLGINSVLNQAQDVYKDIGLYGVFGIRFTTIFSRKSPEFRLNYGLAAEFYSLSLKEDYVFADESNQSTVIESPINLEYSRFTMSTLILPVHIEYGKAKIDYSGNRAKYDFSTDWNYGIGGFVGTKLTSSQSFKYEDEGEDVTKSVQRPYNTDNFLYGLSAYAGYGPFKLNVRYNLNSIFKNSNANGNVLSVGVLLGY